MKELDLNFPIEDNPEILILDNDKKKEIMHEAQDLCMSANELYTRLNDNQLEKGFCTTLLSLFESYTVKLHGLLDYQSVLKKEHDERFKNIREIRIQNRELRKQLDDKVSAEDVREKLKNYNEIIHKWWKKEGFGYVPETSFHPSICQVKISCSMSIHFEKTQPDFLRSKGYEIVESERNSFDLIQSDKNMKLLGSEIIKRFPSAKIFKIEVVNWKIMHIRDVTFNIHDFSDI